MIGEKEIWENLTLIQVLTGLPVEQFLELFSQIEAVYEEYEKERHSRSNRKRAVGGGRKCDTPLVVRVVMVLMYIRLYTTQEVVASIFGKRKWDVCRDLRRLLPLITAQLPTPELINQVKEKGAQGGCIKTLEELLELYPDTIAILDATEQPVEKSKDKEERKRHYSGKKKRTTLKTQILINGKQEIICIYTGVAGSIHDYTMMKDSGVYQWIPKGVALYVDKGYQGIEKDFPDLKVLIPKKKPKGGELTEEEKEKNKQIGKVRVIVEHVIGWMKNFHIFSHVYRTGKDIYGSIVQTVGGLINFRRAYKARTEI
jgi:hypothetical protein